MKRLYYLLFVVLVGISISACSFYEADDGKVVTNETDYETKESIDVDADKIEGQEGNSYDDISADTDMEIGENWFSLSEYNGKHISEKLDCGIQIEADIWTGDSDDLYTYDYLLKNMTEKDMLEFSKCIYDEKVVLEEDERNPGHYEYFYGDEVGEVITAQLVVNKAGPRVDDENGFSIRNNYTNLYPFEDNVIPLSDEEGIIELDSLSITDRIIKNAGIDRDWFLFAKIPYGTQGRNRYDRVIYKKKVDGRFVNSYNEIYFFVDADGVQNTSCTFYDVENPKRALAKIPLETAIRILQNHLNSTDIVSMKDARIDSISVEYLVVQNLDKTIECFPIWRFYFSYGEFGNRIDPNLICGVSIIDGEFYYEERGFFF